MTFEFNYDTETEEIHIIYENYVALKATQEDGYCAFYNFEKIEDAEVEAILKKLCVQAFNIFT
jgi:hypothetical protein